MCYWKYFTDIHKRKPVLVNFYPWNEKFKSYRWGKWQKKNHNHAYLIIFKCHMVFSNSFHSVSFSPTSLSSLASPNIRFHSCPHPPLPLVGTPPQCSLSPRPLNPLYLPTSFPLPPLLHLTQRSYCPLSSSHRWMSFHICGHQGATKTNERQL